MRRKAETVGGNPRLSLLNGTFYWGSSAAAWVNRRGGRGGADGRRPGDNYRLRNSNRNTTNCLWKLQTEGRVFVSPRYDGKPGNVAEPWRREEVRLKPLARHGARFDQYQAVLMSFVSGTPGWWTKTDSQGSQMLLFWSSVETQLFILRALMFLTSPSVWLIDISTMTATQNEILFEILKPGLDNSYNWSQLVSLKRRL